MSNPIRCYVAAPARSAAALAAAVAALLAAGFLVTSATFVPSSASVDDLLAAADDDLAAVACADLVVTLPGSGDLWEPAMAEAFGVPVVALAEALSEV
ncbi:hypothetical protein [Micromonospora sp. WMMD737]|uniref:hypothetical protein n=1 Tax=Micromonospora sp. WMMD737 TaxID=3404113 RepID=UPI003B96205A